MTSFLAALGTFWLRKRFKLPHMLNETANPNDDKASVAMQTSHYQSFLVRIWRAGEAAPWRASITHVATGESQTFISVQALFLYLHEQASQPS